MGFGDAVFAGLAQYAVFSGRAGRAEFWWWQLFLLLASVAAMVVDVQLADTTGFGSAGLLFDLAVFLPSLAVMVRRLHDSDLSGWLVLLALVPLIGVIVLLVLTCRQGDRGANRFGPPPAQNFGP